VDSSGNGSFMGSWGAGSFENDWALDWLADFRQCEDVDFVRTALRRVVEHGGTKQYPASIILRLLGRPHRTDWLDAHVAAQALAAAEIVAAWRGHPAAKLPRDLPTWLKQHATLSQPDLVPLARKAVTIVKTNSELKDLWQEVDADTWQNAVEDLEQRLDGASPHY
jgi:hypothetical protein